MPKRVVASGLVKTALLHRKTVGIDTDRDFLVVGFLDTAKKNVEIAEYPQTDRGHRDLALRCLAFGVEKVVIESTGQYHLAAFDTLREAGLDVICVNPSSVKALLRVEGKSDKRDAATLARIAAGFGLRRSNIPDAEQRELRTFFTVLDEAQALQTRLRNRLNAQLTMNGCTIMRLVSGKTQVAMLHALAEGASPEVIAAMHPRKLRRPLIHEHLTEKGLPMHVRYLTRLALHDIAICEAREGEAKNTLLSLQPMFRHELQLLTSVPFTDELLALRVVAEMGRNLQERYPNRRAFSSAVGTAPANLVSGGKLIKTDTRHGNHRLVNHLTNRLKGLMLSAAYKMTPMGLKNIEYRRRAGFSKALLALSHEVSDGWFITMHFQERYDWRRVHPDPSDRVVLTALGVAAGDG